MIVTSQCSCCGGSLFFSVIIIFNIVTQGVEELVEEGFTHSTDTVIIDAIEIGLHSRKTVIANS